MPYTEALLSAVPIPDPDLAAKRERIVLEGDVPEPINPPSRLPVPPRCRYATDVCREIEPPLTDYERPPGRLPPPAERRHGDARRRAWRPEEPGGGRPALPDDRSDGVPSSAGNRTRSSGGTSLVRGSSV